MTTLLIVFSVMILFIVLMSAGLLLGGKPVSGSCGGMSAVGMKGACDVCGGDLEKCESSKDPIRQEAEDLFYDASKTNTSESTVSESVLSETKKIKD